MDMGNDSGYFQIYTRTKGQRVCGVREKESERVYVCVWMMMMMMSIDSSIYFASIDTASLYHIPCYRNSAVQKIETIPTSVCLYIYTCVCVNIDSHELGYDKVRSN